MDTIKALSTREFDVDAFAAAFFAAPLCGVDVCCSETMCTAQFGASDLCCTDEEFCRVDASCELGTEISASEAEPAGNHHHGGNGGTNATERKRLSAEAIVVIVFGILFLITFILFLAFPHLALFGAAKVAPVGQEDVALGGVAV